MFRIEGIAAEVEIKWTNPESIDSLENWDIAVRKRSVGMPVEQILLELGYDPEIARQIAESAETTQDVSLASSAEALNANNLALQQEASQTNNQEG
jgi:hypothetical protein